MKDVKTSKTLLVLPGSPEERTKALAAALAEVRKQHGEGAIFRMDGTRAVESPGVLSTGVLSLDLATGIGGLPMGRVIEVYGPESSGKTTLTLHAIAATQKAGGVCAFVDAEHALDVGYARVLGVKTEELLLTQPDHGEQALEIADMLARSGAVDLIVVDSVAALVPKAEIEGEMGDSLPGLQARLMSQALRKLTGTVHKTGTTVLFINQLRMKIGVMFGSPETTTGGQALKFYASLRIDIRRGQALKDGDKVLGNTTKLKVVKNKLAAPFVETEVEILYGAGIVASREVLARSVEAGLLEKSGSWFSLRGERIGNGVDRAAAWLAEHPEEMEGLRAAVLAKRGILAAAPANDRPIVSRARTTVKAS